MEATRREALLKEYSEVGNNFRMLTEIRFKLLALLPIAAATAAAFKGDGLGIGGLGLSLFGLAATLGLATYNARNDQLYDELVGRAASIERSLGLPDGAFANRPRPWLVLKLTWLRWTVDHRAGVATIYTASVALWVYGVLAPTLEYVRRVYSLRLQHLVVTDQAIVVHASAFILAIVVTVWGTFAVARQKKSRAKALRAWAAEAVRTAAGLTMSEVADNDELISLCMNLTDEKPETIRSRAQFYSKLAPESLAHYVAAGPPETAAAHVIALLTDLPVRWLFDCATNRRGVVHELGSNPKNASP